MRRLTRVYTAIGISNSKLVSRSINGSSSHEGPMDREKYSGRLLSADSHVMEPRDLWQSRMDRRWHDKAPRIGLARRRSGRALHDELLREVVRGGK